MNTFTVVEFMDELRKNEFDVNTLTYKQELRNGDNIITIESQEKNRWWEVKLDKTVDQWQMVDMGFITL